MSAQRRTTILADPDLLDRIDRLAHRRRTTKTAIITAALEGYLEEHDETADLPFLAIGRSANGRLSLDGRAIVRRDAGRRAAETRPRQG
jgi:predicted DNA-binding protein